MPSFKTAILSVVYYEPEWIQTCTDLANNAQGYPVFFVDRKGTGSLAHAFNSGFKTYQLWEFDYVWMLTNIRFGPNCLEPLEQALEMRPPIAAISPTFDSDHAHHRPKRGSDTNDIIVRDVPFVEFTCPLVRSSVFKHDWLDENMPYSGHDLDWGHRMRMVGLKLGVHPGVKIEHKYIRHSKSRHPATIERARLRAAAEEPTKRALAAKYGPDWFDVVRCKY
jgi:GT2 family glycosyltransferase